MSGKAIAASASDWGGETVRKTSLVDDTKPAITIPDGTSAVTIFKNQNRAETLPPIPTLQQHQRIKEYQVARTITFGVASNRTKKVRIRYKKRKQLRREIAATTLFAENDCRFYAKIDIAGVEVEGLVGSGATVTCLGKGCGELVERAGLNVHQFGSCTKTADGSTHRIFGRVRAKINFGTKSAEVNLYLVPTLERALLKSRLYETIRPICKRGEP